MNIYKLLIAVFVCMLFKSCTSTRLTSNWHDPKKTITINTLKKVLVVAIFKNEASNRTAEDQMAAYLNGKGVVAYNYLNDKIDKKSTVDVRNKIRVDGFDGAITMRLIDVDKEKVYTPSSRNIYPDYYRTFDRYYYRGWNNYNSPGYFTTTKTFVIEVIVFSIKEDSVIWVGVTKTTNPNGVEQLISEVAEIVYSKMKKQRFINE